MPLKPPVERPTGLPAVPTSRYTPQSVPRDTDYDLEFSGFLLARHRHSGDGDRWTEVALYRTEGGAYVAAVQFGSLSRTTMRRIACVCGTPEEVVAWIREGSGGRIGTPSKIVLQQAYERHPDLWPLRPVEVVP